MAGLVEKPACGFVVVADEQAQQPEGTGLGRNGFIRLAVVAVLVIVAKSSVSGQPGPLKRPILRDCHRPKVLPMHHAVHQPLGLRQHQGHGESQQQRCCSAAHRSGAGPVHGIAPAERPT